jgi:hypothetical protein
MQRKITKASVEAAIRDAQKRGARVYVWDTELCGFGFNASKNGASWLAQKWKGGRGGRPVRWVIGQYPHVQPDDARDMAIAQLSKIGDAVTATDLMTPKQRVHSALQESVRAAIQAPKLGECIDTYIKLNRKPGRYWVELKSTFERDIIPVLGKDTIVADITDAEVQHLLDTKRAKHPGAARNLYAMGLRPFFKWCLKRKIIVASPAEKIDAPKNVEKRDRVLSEAEIKFFWLATSSLAEPYGAFHRVLLLTAQRREEVAGMKWSELDTNASTRTIPKERTKNGKEHLIHLYLRRRWRAFRSRAIARSCFRLKGGRPAYRVTRKPSSN